MGEKKHVEGLILVVVTGLILIAFIYAIVSINRRFNPANAVVKIGESGKQQVQVYDENSPGGVRDLTVFEMMVLDSIIRSYQNQVPNQGGLEYVQQGEVFVFPGHGNPFASPNYGNYNPGTIDIQWGDGGSGSDGGGAGSPDGGAQEAQPPVVFDEGGIGVPPSDDGGGDIGGTQQPIPSPGTSGSSDNWIPYGDDGIGTLIPYGDDGIGQP